MVEQGKLIGNLFVDHFKNLFTKGRVNTFDWCLNQVDKVVTGDMNDFLYTLITLDEVKTITFQIGVLNALGPNEFPQIFYQANQSTIGSSVTHVVQNFFLSSKFPQHFNHTYLVLIPKVQNPTLVTQFHLISLCNCVCKIISKILVNRLKVSLDELILENHNAFMAGRLIQDNIIITHEIFHCLKTKKEGKKAFALSKWT